MALDGHEFLERILERRRFGMRPGLEAMRAALAEMGNPHQTLKCIHVAGTNGKGATCALLDSILRAAGWRVARYTSPHLISIGERFFLDGRPVDPGKLDAVAAEVFPAIERVEREQGLQVTFFEALTLVAFALFAREKPDVVVLETGLGGRLDATNVIEDPLVSVITHVGLDHCEWLGSTYPAVAEEKAGIIKPGRPVVCGAMPAAAREVVGRIASLNGSAFWSVEDTVTVDGAKPLLLTTALRNLPPVNFALPGLFQIDNAKTALAVADVLTREGAFPVPNRALIEGLEKVVWPGRFQPVEKDGVKMFVDGAHNPDGAMALRDALRAEGVRMPVGLVAGYCDDKDVMEHLRIMSAVATYGWATPIRNSRSLAPDAVADRMALAGFAVTESCVDLNDALERASAWARESGGTVVVSGSLFLAGEALAAMGAFPWEVREPDANEAALRR